MLTATKTIQNLVMNAAADWFRFQTLGVGTTNSVTVSFDPTAGDMDLTLYGSDGATVVQVGGQRLRRGQRQPRDDRASPVCPPGTYYAVVTPHTAGFGIASTTPSRSPQA